MIRNLAFLAMALCAALFAASAAAVAGPKEDCAAKSGDVAIAGCTELIRRNSKDAVAYYNRGNAYDDTGEQNRAIADYTRAIELNPNYAEAYTSRGNAYDDKGEHDRAIADYNPRHRAEPEPCRGLFQPRPSPIRARASTTGAIADYTRAIEG